MDIQNIYILLALAGCAVAKDVFTDPGRMEILTLTMNNDRLFEIFKMDYGEMFKISYLKEILLYFIYPNSLPASGKMLSPLQTA